jgi:hypothetical protein
MDDKIPTVTLVRDDFKANMEDFKKLTAQDRIELGSGIAKNMGLTEGQLNFKPVAY